MYTSENRVIRDGYLIAFEGEAMSDEEAAKRGLLDPEPDEKPKPKSTRRKAKPKAAEDEEDEEYDEDEEA